MNRALLTAAMLVLLPVAACDSDDPAPPASGCSDSHLVGDVCAGVPQDNLCAGTGCAPGGDYCSAVLEVSSDADLQNAVGDAGDGTCIVLAPGVYGAVILPPVRMAISGEHPSTTTVASVTSTGGSDVRISGIATGSVTLDAGSGTLDALRIENGATDGVHLGAGASVTITRSEISGHARYGVSAFDAGSVTLDGNVIELNGGPGMWIQSGDTSCDACGCASTVTGTIKNTVFDENALVGISVVRAASLDIENVEVRNSKVGGDFEGGGGVSIAHCSSVTADGLRVLDNADYGVLVHDASVTLDGGAVSNNLRGIWIQEIGTSQLGSVTVRGTQLDGNRGVGLGIAEQSADVLIEDVEIRNTALVSLPVIVDGISAGAADVGDGINWLATSKAILRSVTVGNSARQSVLIDGEVVAGSEIENLTQIDGDETKGILQQSFSSGTQPVTSGTSPQVMTNADRPHETPQPLVPPGI